MKPLHLPLEGHDLLAVERFKDDTRHMAEFLILSTHCPLGRRGQYKRLFLTEDEYAPDAVPGTPGPASDPPSRCNHRGAYPARQTQKAPPLMAGAPIGGFKYGRL